MKGDDLSRLEAMVRDANPVPQALRLVDSEEAAAVTLLLSRAKGMDIPGLLPGLPELRPSKGDEEDLLERGHDMDTQERIQEQDWKRQQDTKRPRRWRTAAISFAAVILVAAVVGVGLVIVGDGDGELAVDGRGPEITFVDPDGELSAHAATISRLIEETYAQAAPLLDVDGVRFSVSPDIPGVVFEDYGVGYLFADVDSVVIAIQAWLPGLGDVLPERVPQIVAWSLYEVARQRGVEYGGTMLEFMVWWGLSAHFAEELLGSPTAPWSDAFPVTQTQELMDQARPLFDSTDYDDARWFRGTADLPLWAGFTLGYRMIETYQAENPGQTAADLVNTPTSVFRPGESTGGE